MHNYHEHHRRLFFLLKHVMRATTTMMGMRMGMRTRVKVMEIVFPYEREKECILAANLRVLQKILEMGQCVPRIMIHVPCLSVLSHVSMLLWIVSSSSGRDRLICPVRKEKEKEKEKDENKELIERLEQYGWRIV